MAKSADYPERLRPYVFHGVDLVVKGTQGVGDCPFCGESRKFFVVVGDGRWNCRRCATGNENGGGNEASFLALLWERSVKATPDTAYRELAASRGLMPETLKAWGVARSLITGEWLVPGHGVDGKVKQLYRWITIDGQRRLAATPGQHAMHGLHLWDDKKPEVYVCEGPWDGMALWETLNTTRVLKGVYCHTKTQGVTTLLGKSNVVAVPGAGTFLPYWLSLFAGKKATFLYDSDHEKTTADGKVVPPVGHAGMRRACGVLLGCKHPPEELRYLHWGDEGYDPTLPTGYDVRDWLARGASPQDRSTLVGKLLVKAKTAPLEWKTDPAALEDRTAQCSRWADLVAQWEKAMRWTEGLDRALSVMLASAASTQMVGSQLWVQVVSPPSTGKTQLCDALGTSYKYVKEVGNFTGLHSGMQTDSEGKEDNSTLVTLKDKTFVVKDGDTLLKNPAREKILSQVRDAYDTNCSVSYGNKIKREYRGLRFTFVMCGTESLLELDSADLGARFLTCVIMDKIDRDLETAINHRAFDRILNNRGMVANGKPGTQDDPTLVAAKAMTGGYVEYLRENTGRLLEALTFSDPDGLRHTIDQYAQFVAFMRARPSKTQAEVTTREMSTRLTEQLTKLMLNLAVVLNRQVDAEVMRRVRQVVLDTARGRTLDLVRELVKSTTGEDGKGSVPEALAIRLGREEDDVRRDLRFLHRVGVCEPFTKKTAVTLPNGLVVSSGEQKGRWRPTPRFLDLYNTVTTMTTK